MPVEDRDLPQLFLASDKASHDGQRNYVNLTQARLYVLVAGAACGVVSLRIGQSSIDILATAAVFLFIAALILESILWRNHPERDWYDGRAIAESVKTLAWKYAVGGDPFPVGTSTETAESKLLERMDELRHGRAAVMLDPVVGPAITAWMQETRSRNLTERRDIYLADRIGAQQAWYSDKAKYNKRRSRLWKRILIALELTAVGFSILGAVIDLGFNLPSVIAVAIAAIAAWLQTKQHDQLARAYAITVSDLASVRTKLTLPQTESDWAREMNDAEEAISREHTLWLASRSS